MSRLVSERKEYSYIIPGSIFTEYDGFGLLEDAVIGDLSNHALSIGEGDAGCSGVLP